MVFLKVPHILFTFYVSVVLGIVVVSPASRPAHESLIGRFAKVLGHFTKVSFSLVFFEVFNCPNTLAKRPETSANWLLAKRPVTVLRDREGVRRHRLPFGIDYRSASITVQHQLPFGMDYRSASITFLYFGIDYRSASIAVLYFAIDYLSPQFFGWPYCLPCLKGSKVWCKMFLSSQEHASTTHPWWCLRRAALRLVEIFIL